MPLITTSSQQTFTEGPRQYNKVKEKYKNQRGKNGTIIYRHYE